MRIAGGRHRSRPLAAPRGLVVRPTADRTREALFDILMRGRLLASDRRLPGARVLDAFAGTGALGLEALSRGAGRATFIENHAAALTALRDNIATLGEDGNARVVQADVLRPPPCPVDAACAIVLMDPPYNQGLAEPALPALADAGWIADDALVSVELMKSEPFTPPADFEQIDARTYGKAKLVFLRHAPAG